MTSRDPLYLIHWPKFKTALLQRLEKGHGEYGDGSFDRPLLQLIQEVREEALDLAGWGLMIFGKLEALEEKVKGVEDA